MNSANYSRISIASLLHITLKSMIHARCEFRTVGCYAKSGLEESKRDNGGTWTFISDNKLAILAS